METAERFILLVGGRKKGEGLGEERARRLAGAEAGGGREALGLAKSMPCVGPFHFFVLLRCAC